MTDRGQGRFDGIPVTLYAGKFSGTFEMEEEIGEEVAYDDVVCFVVIATADKAAIDSNNGGDLRRTNTFAITNAQVISPELAQKVLNTVDGIQDVQLQAVAGPTGDLEVSVPDDSTFDDEPSYLDADDEGYIAPAPVTGTRVAPPERKSDPVLDGFLRSAG